MRMKEFCAPSFGARIAALTPNVDPSGEGDVGMTANSVRQIRDAKVTIEALSSRVEHTQTDFEFVPRVAGLVDTLKDL